MADANLRAVLEGESTRVLASHKKKQKILENHDNELVHPSSERVELMSPSRNGDAPHENSSVVCDEVRKAEGIFTTQ
jgi:hypothetical protein